MMTTKRWIDAHGNRKASILRNGSHVHNLLDVRGYDACGKAVSGATTGRPGARYCASVGHRADDESGLVYMRALYYDPQAGRFINEDIAKRGLNWFSYCDGNPVSLADRNGKAANTPEEQILSTLRRLVGTSMTVIGGFLLLLASYTAHISNPQTILQSAQIAAIGVLLVGLGGFTIYAHNSAEQIGSWGLASLWTMLIKTDAYKLIQTIVASTAVGNETEAQAAVAGVADRSLAITAALFAIELEENLFR